MSPAIKAANGAVLSHADFFKPRSLTKDEAQFESYCDSIAIGIKHETLRGFYGDAVADRYQERMRRENALDKCWERIEEIQASGKTDLQREQAVSHAITDLACEIRKHYDAKGRP